MTSRCMQVAKLRSCRRGTERIMSKRSRSVRDPAAIPPDIGSEQIQDGSCPIPATWTRVHRCDQKEVSRIRQRLTNAQIVTAAFERLTKDLQDIPVKLGELVHEQDAAVSERYLAWARRGSSADDGDAGSRVVRVPEGAPLHHGLSVRQQAGSTVHSRHLQDLLAHHRWHDPWQSLCKHRLARPWRTREQDIVPSGRGNLHGPLGRRLSLDVGEVQGRIDGSRRWIIG